MRVSPSSSNVDFTDFQIQKVSDEKVLEKIEKVLGRIDDDQDGSLKIEDVLKVKNFFAPLKC